MLVVRPGGHENEGGKILWVTDGRKYAQRSEAYNPMMGVSTP